MAQADFKAARAVIFNSIVLASNCINNISQAFSELSKSVLFLGQKEIKIRIEKNIEAVYIFLIFLMTVCPKSYFAEFFLLDSLQRVASNKKSNIAPNKQACTHTHKLALTKSWVCKKAHRSPF